MTSRQILEAAARVRDAVAAALMASDTPTAAPEPPAKTEPITPAPDTGPMYESVASAITTGPEATTGVRDSTGAEAIRPRRRWLEQIEQRNHDFDDES
jgi:hypothetical protein